MNHLEQIKQQLMVKPDIQERERVAVVIKGEKKPRALKEKKKTEPNLDKKFLKGITDMGEQIAEIEKIEGILPIDIDIPKIFKVKDDEEEGEKEETNKRPLIIDKTNQGYDR